MKERALANRVEQPAVAVLSMTGPDCSGHSSNLVDTIRATPRSHLNGIWNKIG